MAYLQATKLHCQKTLVRKHHELIQSPRAWYDRIDTSLRKVGLQRSSYNTNLYFLHKNQELLLVMLYVDDLFITGSCPTIILWIKKFLHETFDMTDLEKVKKYLGVNFEYLLHGILLHQAQYTLSILREFLPSGLFSCQIFLAC